MLYVFAGFPGKDRHVGSIYLNAGGLQHCIEEVESLAILEHDPAIQYRKEGVFQLVDEAEEQLQDVEYRVSDLCLRDGITWDWFNENWSFGNGVTVHKTLASPEYRTVVHGTDLTLDEYLAMFGGIKLADMELRRKHERTEGWEAYEKRWLPGTCPQENHVVHLTWLVTKHRLPEFAYERIRQLTEVPGETVDERLYEPKHFSATRIYGGAPALHTGAPGGLG